MDSLVAECVIFCHQNMAAIVSIPCNMNCIGDSLVDKIAALFTHNEIEDLKDRKDKFRSKLFMKKIEALFRRNEDAENTDDGVLDTIFRCRHCQKILTQKSEPHITCLPTMAVVSRKGKLVYLHDRDPSFDVNAYVGGLKRDLGAWRDVYWRLWGVSHCLKCARCGQTFQCHELTGCRYHALEPTVEQSETDPAPLRHYACCGARATHFALLPAQQGCRVKDHVVSLDGLTESDRALYDDLIRRKQAVCLDQAAMLAMNVQYAGDVNIFETERTAMQRVLNRENDPIKRSLLAPVASPFALGMPFDDAAITCADGYNAYAMSSLHSYIGGRAAATPSTGLGGRGGKNTLWDMNKSTRFNQDNQRDDDRVRMEQLTQYVASCRIPNAAQYFSPADVRASKIGSHLRPAASKQEYAGGVFSRLEAQWRSQINSRSGQSGAQRQTRTFGAAKTSGRIGIPF